MEVIDRPHTAKIWLLATRPKTWIASISPVLIGSAMSMKEGFFHPWLFLVTLLTALGIQIETNLANDYFDFVRGADTAERQGPTRVMQAGLVTKSSMKKAIFITCTLTLLGGCYLAFFGGAFILALVILSIILGLAYTTGPYPLSYLGLSEGFILFFFGSLAVAGTYFLQTGHWTYETWMLGLCPGMLSSAILVVNNLRDYNQDLIAKKKTLVVRFGKWFGRSEYIAFVLGAFLLPLCTVKSHPFLLLYILAFPPFIPLIVTICRSEDPAVIAPVLPQTGRLFFFYTLLLSIGWMF